MAKKRIPIAIVRRKIPKSMMVNKMMPIGSAINPASAVGVVDLNPRWALLW